MVILECLLRMALPSFGLLVARISLRIQLEGARVRIHAFRGDPPGWAVLIGKRGEIQISVGHELVLLQIPSFYVKSVIRDLAVIVKLSHRRRRNSLGYTCG